MGLKKKDNPPEFVNLKETTTGGIDLLRISNIGRLYTEYKIRDMGVYGLQDYTSYFIELLNGKTISVSELKFNEIKNKITYE